MKNLTKRRIDKCNINYNKAHEADINTKKEQVSKYNANYREKHRTEINEKAKLNYHENKEEKLAYQKEWTIRNQEYKSEYQRQYYINNIDKLKANNKDFRLKKKFGLSLEEYMIMQNEQNGCCLICGKHFTDFSIALAVDHDHKTGKVRGLLCAKCNTGLGCFDDNIDRMISAMEYLKKYNN